ncbi:MAG: hypothetical protein ACUVSZ_08880 [Chloroflexus sp.]
MTAEPCPEKPLSSLVEPTLSDAPALAARVRLNEIGVPPDVG